ncbi:TIGR01621 family pseudouridine synthase [Algibacillus agarilyticus]|uniref:TIGR01621 family pseudouridine synthase n=1 Tax=Algibacillus agarilyticus TaxID=2234133 RepID=UPI000DD00EB9|nr:TIGR01621 family pseudouridine synthase [Algibacillus agarilyticus]
MHVIYQNSDFIVVNKPENCDFHDDSQTQTIGFFNQVKEHLAVDELYPVHRLDKVTSGLIIMAKNLTTELQFNHAFTNKKIDKFYVALATNKPKKKQGKITGDMSKSRNKTWMLNRTFVSPATTLFKSFALGSANRLYLLKPLTGKTHQLRVAMKSNMAAILGDELYKGVKSDRTYLHAYAVRFAINEQDYAFICPPTTGEFFNHDAVKTQFNNPEFTSPWDLDW